MHDTDIYGNLCDGITDDAISLDGNAANMRVWNNTIVRSQTGISITPILIGPVYIFRNVIYEPELHWTGACRWVKGGESSTGYVYFYHNTVVLDDRVAEADGKDCPVNYGLSTGQGRGSNSINVFVKNNIIETDGPVASPDQSIPWPKMDYDLIYNHYSDPGGSAFRNYWMR